MRWDMCLTVGGAMLLTACAERVRADEVEVSIDLTTEPYLISWSTDAPMSTVDVYQPDGETACKNGDVWWANPEVYLKSVYYIRDPGFIEATIEGPVEFGEERDGTQFFFTPSYDPGPMFVQISRFEPRSEKSSKLTLTGCVGFTMP